MGTEANFHRPLQKPQQPASWLAQTQKIFSGIEIALWVIFLFAWIFQVARKPYAEEIVVLTLTTISALYMLVPFLVLGSRGWKRHIGSFFVGQALSLAVISLLFLVEYWPLAEEMRIVSFMPCFFATICTSVFMWLNFDKNPNGSRFYSFVMLRLLLGLLITAAPMLRLLL